MAVRTGSFTLRRRQQTSLLSALLVSGALLAGAMLIARRDGKPVSEPRQPVVVAQFDTVNVPVPVSSVPAGTKVKDIRFKIVTFPRHQVPQGAVVDIAPLIESVSVAPLPANLPVFGENFSATFNSSNPVIERIPSGMRAMTIKVDATAAVEGWAGSGALVDVLLISKERTSVVAEKVKILSAERSVSPVDGNGTPNVPSTATLLVTQEQCLAINTAIPLGKIAFALRSSTDEQNWNDTLYTADRLRGGQAVRQKSAAVNGVVTVKDSDGTFALADGKWIKTDSIPSGFLLNQER